MAGDANRPSLVTDSFGSALSASVNRHRVFFGVRLDHLSLLAGLEPHGGNVHVNSLTGDLGAGDTGERP